MPEHSEITEELYEKLKPYESSEVPLAPTSVLIAGGSRSLQKILDLLEELPKISVAELEIERPDYSQFMDLKKSANAAFKVNAAEYLSQWGIGFKYKISISRNLYESLINYVDKNGFVKEKV